MSSEIVEAGKYRGWTVRMGEDLDVETEIVEDMLGRGLVRIHSRISRTPARREFVIRCLTCASEADRAEARSYVADISRVFAAAERAGAANRMRTRDGGWTYLIWPGSSLEDPLVQLELEMMIDLHSAVTS